MSVTQPHPRRVSFLRVSLLVFAFLGAWRAFGESTAKRNFLPPIERVEYSLYAEPVAERNGVQINLPAGPDAMNILFVWVDRRIGCSDYLPSAELDDVSGETPVWLGDELPN